MTHRPDIDIDQLRALLAVAETGGFTAAAGRINRTQSAVSQKIARLEDQLGWKVFARNSRGLRLTPRGEALLESARKLIVDYERFLDGVQGATPETNLRLGVSENLIATRLPALLAQLNAEQPGRRIDLSTAPGVELLHDLDEGRLDIVVTRQRSGDGAARGRVAWREPMAWVASSSFREDEGDSAPLVLLREPCAYRDAGIAALEAAGRPWTAACVVGNLASLEAAVLAGLGVTPQARSFARAGMKVLKPSRRWPVLPETEIAVFGDEGHAAHVEALAAMLSTAG
ncbi:LysR substrate-binding domain-containing protein [Luteibacter sp. NPDC031894]|uniref:LysR substrate-binding domain-containing protein n=1 Tax=Luteibacter sp. NPDC031894 TaxID=3390572 RepID=UPI003D04E36A